MDLGSLEGQTRGDYFLNSISDPSVNQCTGECKPSGEYGRIGQFGEMLNLEGS